MVVPYSWFCPFVYCVLAELPRDAWGKTFIRANSLKIARTMRWSHAHTESLLSGDDGKAPIIKKMQNFAHST